jgi:hypothetical protein
MHRSSFYPLVGLYFRFATYRISVLSVTPPCDVFPFVPVSGNKGSTVSACSPSHYYTVKCLTDLTWDLLPDARRQLGNYMFSKHFTIFTTSPNLETTGTKMKMQYERNSDFQLVQFVYRVTKKSLCTWWLQYRKLLGSIWLLGSQPPGPWGHDSR